MNRIKSQLITVLLLVVLIAGCNGTEEEVNFDSFIGGSQGVTVSFVEMRNEVFDGGEDPFDIIVKLENMGETDVDLEDIQVRISGVRPEEFDKTVTQLTQNSPEDVVGARIDAQGNQLPGVPVLAEFTNLNHVGTIIGSSIDFPIRAEACYKYATQAVTKLCVRKNILNPSEGGLCEINEAKQVANSGSPIQIQNIKESGRGSKKIGFSFDVVHLGAGSPYTLGGSCERERVKNKVTITVDTKQAGLSCTGLGTQIGSSVSGEVTLFGGKKTISCSQEVDTTRDFEFAAGFNLGYNYLDSQTMQLKVKKSRE
jgi:hypothetical protein